MERTCLLLQSGGGAVESEVKGGEQNAGFVREEKRRLLFQILMNGVDILRKKGEGAGGDSGGKRDLTWMLRSCDTRREGGGSWGVKLLNQSTKGVIARGGKERKGRRRDRVKRTLPKVGSAAIGKREKKKILWRREGREGPIH